MTAPQRGNPLPHSRAHRIDSLTDNYGRQITYLRLAITDRCNLRCRYCMPLCGVDFVPHAEMLSFEELERLVRLLSALGLSKIRITGGEPFARRDCLPFMWRLQGMDTVSSLHITTNGVKTLRYLDELAALGIAGINLSLDTLDRNRFQQISRRDHLAEVLATLDGCIVRRLPLKINAVVLEDTTDAEILALAELPERHPLCLRFIEKMPFSGTPDVRPQTNRSLRDRLHHLFPAMLPLVTGVPATARLYDIPGFAGTIGLIEGNSRRFCATCNKIRITPTGMLKTCLYDNGVLDLKAMLRSNAADHEITAAVRAVVSHRYRDGLATEANCRRATPPTMASIGG